MSLVAEALLASADRRAVIEHRLPLGLALQHALELS